MRQRFFKTAHLNFEVEHFRLVCCCKMRKNAFKFQRAMKINLHQKRAHFIVAHTNAVHPAVHSQVIWRFYTVRIGTFAVRKREGHFIN